MHFIKEIPNDWETEAMASYTIAKNHPGQGEWYIELLAYRGVDADDADMGLVAYDYRLGWFDRAIEMIERGDDVDHPEELLGLVPQQWREVMRAQIAEFVEGNSLPRLIDGTLLWDCEFELGEGTHW